MDSARLAPAPPATRSELPARNSIHIRKCRAPSRGEWLIVGRGLEWVEPDERVRAARQTRHLAFDLFRVAAVPAVRRRNHDRAASEPAVVLAIERPPAPARCGCRRTSPPPLRRRRARERRPDRARATPRSRASGACRRRTPRHGGAARRPACTRAACARRARSARTRRTPARAGVGGGRARARWRSNGSPAVPHRCPRRAAQVADRRAAVAAPRRRAWRVRRAGPAARRRRAAADPARAPALGSPCTPRSPCRAAARRAAHAPRTASTSSPPLTGIARRATATGGRGSTNLATASRPGGGSGGGGAPPARTRGERRVERGQVLLTRAERRPQREVGVGLAVGRVDGGQRAYAPTAACPPAREPRRRASWPRAGQPPGQRAPTRWAAPSSTPPSRTASMSSRTFSTAPDDARGRSSPGPAAPAPSRASPDARQLVQSSARRRATAANTRRAIASGTSGKRALHDLRLALGARVVDPVVEAAPLERVVQLARAVRGDDDQPRPRGRGWSPARGS